MSIKVMPEIVTGFNNLSRAINSLENGDNSGCDKHLALFNYSTQFNSELKEVQEKAFRKVWKWKGLNSGPTDNRTIKVWNNAKKQQFGQNVLLGTGDCQLQASEKLAVLKSARLSFLKHQLLWVRQQLAQGFDGVAEKRLNELLDIQDPAIKKFTNKIYKALSNPQEGVTPQELISLIDSSLNAIKHKKFSIPSYIENEAKAYYTMNCNLYSDKKFVCSNVDTSTVDYSSNRNMFNSILQQFPGIFLGERHDRIDSKKLFIDNLDYFKSQGVTTLFLEISSELQEDVDTFYRTGKMPDALYMHLSRIDQSWKSPYPYSFMGLLCEARQKGIRVVFMDSNQAIVRNNSIKRLSLMNYTAAKIIKHEKGNGKFLALMGSHHTSTYAVSKTENAPGLSQLLKCPTVYVIDTQENKINKNAYTFTSAETHIRYDFVTSNTQI